MASMIQDLLKTPEQVREDQLNKLREQGQASAGALLAQRGSDPLSNAILGHAAGIAQSIPSSTQGMVSGLMQAGGAAAGMAGKEQAAQALQQAAMSQPERQAVATQQITKEAAGSKDPKRLRTLAERLAAVNPAAAEVLTAKAEKLEAAQAEAGYKEREIAVKEAEAGVKAAEDKRKANQLGNVLGVEIKDVTIESQAEARRILEEGANADGTYPNNVMADALLALKTLDKKPVTTIDMKGENAFSVAMGKANSDLYVEGLAKVGAAQEGLRNTTNALEMIGKGIITGATGNIQLAAKEFLLELGVVDEKTKEQIANTREYLQATGRSAVAALASGDYGSGNSLTEKDLENAKKLEANDLSIDEASLRRILDFNQKTSIHRIKKHNEQVDRLNERYPEMKLRKENYVGQYYRADSGDKYVYSESGTWDIVKDEAGQGGN